MKFVCFGYIEPEKFENMPKNEREAILDDCFDFDDRLRASGNFIPGAILQPPKFARTINLKNGRVMVTDGPFAETKEQIGGFLVLEASDLDHASELLSQHPALQFGPWEIRPAGDLNAIVEESKRRRGKPA